MRSQDTVMAHIYRQVGGLLFAFVCAVALITGACSGPEDDGKNVDPNADPNSSENNVCVGANCADMGGTDACGGCEAGLFCEPSSATCIECLVDEQCGGGAICDQVARTCACPQGTHFCDKSCLPDDSVDSCGDRCQPCPGDPNGTATCQAGGCALECDDGLFYDGPTNSCVECATSNDCADPTAPVCVDGFCGACSSNDDCAGREATPVCDTDSGACVECTAADSSLCGNFVCDLDSGSCSDVLAGSSAPCQTCTYDSECSEGSACVIAEYKGTVRPDRYCYPRLTDPVAGCPGAGYSKPVMRTSTQASEPEAFCTINESLTTCEAVLAYGTKRGVCINQSDCGVEPDDALCEPTEFEAASCTYLCDTAADCPNIFEANCTLSDVEGPRYCGAY